MSETVEMRAWGGGQVDSDAHGDVTVGVRRGPWRAELYTDTLELAWGPEGPRGRAWVAARGAAFAAEMMISPWTDGAPDPTRAMGAAYGGVEAGALRYLGHGLYAGGQGSFRYYAFFAYGGADPLPAHPVARADAVLGRWTETWQAEIHLGARAEPTAEQLLQPHAEGSLRWREAWLVAPALGLHAAVADGQSDLTRTRLGGLTPYAVPLAGAAWAEWRVEDHVAARAGLSVGPPHLRGEVGLDHATFVAPDPGQDPAAPVQHAQGFYLAGHGAWRKLYADVAVGYAPWITRQADVSRLSAYFRLGLDWAPLRR